MNILEKIIVDKKAEVQLKKNLIPAQALEKIPLFNRKTLSLSNHLREATFGIIAEHKRRSPSKAVINQKGTVASITSGYQQAGASAISVLTDGKYFGGSLDDLVLARASVDIPLLRKEFMIDPYQVIEARAYGADLILLIAAVLKPVEIKQLAALAKELEMDVLLEIHNEEELRKSLIPEVDLIGVNNRNLKTFEVSLETSKNLASKIPDEFIKVSESGISSAEAIKELLPFGFKGFLIGEQFMKTENPGSSASQFIEQIREKQH